MLDTIVAPIKGNCYCQGMEGKLFTFLIDTFKETVTTEENAAVDKTNLVNAVSQVPALSRNRTHKNIEYIDSNPKRALKRGYKCCNITSEICKIESRACPTYYALVLSSNQL